MKNAKNRWPRLDPDSGVEDVTLLVMEWLGEQGVEPMLRLDVERLREGRPAWTFVVGGGSLPHVVRTDGTSAGECMGMALHSLRKAGLDVPF